MSRLRSALLAAVSAALVLTGCTTGPSNAGDNQPKTDGTSGTQTSSAAYPVTIKHAFGEATITSEPKRVVTLGWTDADHVAALGVAPVGAPKVSWGGNANMSSDWFDKQIATFGGAAPTRFDDTDGNPVEEIAQLQPDLILATNSGLTKEEYDKLSKLAPVVAYPKVAWGTPWRESLDIIGKALGRTDKAAEIAKATDAVIASAATKYPQIVGKTFIYGYIAPTDRSQIGYYTPTDLRPRMLEDFGLKAAPVLAELTGDSTEFYRLVSAEKATTLVSDVFLTTIDDDAEVPALRKDPLVGQVPAIKSGALVAPKDRRINLTMSSPSPLSIPYAVDLFVPLVAKAIEEGAGA